jgi:predicted dehydrogenase
MESLKIPWERLHMTVNRVSLVLVGAGLRGVGYTRHAVASGKATVTALAEPDPDRRARFAAEFGVPAHCVFSDWRELVSAGKLGDAALVTTQDTMHADPAVALAGLGYHLLLEKPMAPSEPEAIRIAEAVDQAGIIFAVCHVLRYTPYTRVLKQLLDEGRIGRLINVQHLEPVGWWHQAHSFVRGHWNNSGSSAPMLLTKACHDIDWLLHLFGTAPARVSSFGGLTHFRQADRPAGAADRCVDCALEPQCAYSAPRLYLSCLGDPTREFWPLSPVTSTPTKESVLDALRTGPYGRCVYASDNDVVDHQVVTMEFPDGATCSFTMTAFTAMDHRQTRLFGTHGSIEGDGVTLRVFDFLSETEDIIDTHAGLDSSAAGGHGGGDVALVEAFLRAVETGDPSVLRTDAAASLSSHRVVWAAEHARETGQVVPLAGAGRTAGGPPLVS